MSSSKKILIINIFGIGDVLFTTPVVSALRAQFPDCFIGYIANRRAQTVLAGNPKINRFFIYERDEFQAVWRKDKRAWWRKVCSLLQEVRAERFEVVLDFSLNAMIGFLTQCIGIPQRIGFDYKKRGRFLTAKKTINGFVGRHVVEDYLGLLEHLAVPVQPQGLEVHLSEEDRKAAETTLSGLGVKPEDRLVGIIPGGGISWGKDLRYRRWQPEKYGALADQLIEKYGLKVILLGDLSEKETGEQVSRSMRGRPLSFLGETSLNRYLALLERCVLAVMTDGGPLHMAVAAGAKTVSLFGPVDEKVYGPYPPAGHFVVTKDIACRPCYRNFRRADCEHVSCLRTITVEEVAAKVEEALLSAPARPETEAAA